MTLLRGKSALVTGGARRLGRAIALALAGAGAHVTIHVHHSFAAGEATVRDLQALGSDAGMVQGDLADTGEAERIVDLAIARRGCLDLLVNNAGAWGATPVGATTAERWDELFDTNLRGMYFATQRAAPALRETGGSVVNIADVGAFRPWRNHAPYLATKGGVVTLTYALARDLAPEVRVNAVAPGPVLLPDDWSAEQGRTLAKATLLKRVGRPEDIGQAVVYLATAAYVTGVVLPVDGGFLLA